MQRATRYRGAHLLALDVAIPAGFALMAFTLFVGISWLGVMDPTALPRAAHSASTIRALLLPGLSISLAGTTALTAVAVGFAALAVARLTERHQPIPRVR